VVQSGEMALESGEYQHSRRSPKFTHFGPMLTRSISSWMFRLAPQWLTSALLLKLRSATKGSLLSKCTLKVSRWMEPPTVGGTEWKGPRVNVEAALVTVLSRVYVVGTLECERMFGDGDLPSQLGL